MAHDVFISHSKADKPTADAVCAALEVAGIRCWIAPRDVLPGMTWSGSIVRAIGDSRIMVLVFSSNSNGSQQVLREVDCAVNEGVVVVPFRIEDVRPSDDMKFYLGTPHWLDAITPPLTAHLKSLCNTVQAILPALRAKVAGEDSSPVPSGPVSARPQSQAVVAEADILETRVDVPKRPPRVVVPQRGSMAVFPSGPEAPRYVRLRRFAFWTIIVVLGLFLLGTLFVGPGGSDDKKIRVTSFCVFLAPLLGIALSSRWPAASKLHAIVLGWACTCASGIVAAALVGVGGLVGQDNGNNEISVLGIGIVDVFSGVLVGLIRAFLMTQPPKEPSGDT